jgi:hypothetical protein
MTLNYKKMNIILYFVDKITQKSLFWAIKFK